MITVIILLILAGTAISIAVNGDNLFGKTETASKETTIGAIKESAKLEILLEQATEEGLTKEKFKAILDKYFEDIDTLELPDDLSNSDIKLNANQTYGGYKNIALSDIYNGKFSTTNATSQIPDITKNKWRYEADGEEIGIYKFGKNGNVYRRGKLPKHTD